MNTLTIRRVGYSKDSTLPEDREYRMLSGGPVGTIDDWKKYAEEKEYDELLVLGKDCKTEMRLLLKTEDDAAKKADLDRKIIHLAYEEDGLFHHPKTKGDYIALQDLLLHQHKIGDVHGLFMTAMQLMPTKLMLEDKK